VFLKFPQVFSSTLEQSNHHKPKPAGSGTNQLLSSPERAMKVQAILFLLMLMHQFSAFSDALATFNKQIIVDLYKSSGAKVELSPKEIEVSFKKFESLFQGDTEATLTILNKNANLLEFANRKPGITTIDPDAKYAFTKTRYEGKPTISFETISECFEIYTDKFG